MRLFSSHLVPFFSSESLLTSFTMLFDRHLILSFQTLNYCYLGVIKVSLIPIKLFSQLIQIWAVKNRSNPKTVYLGRRKAVFRT